MIQFQKTSGYTPGQKDGQTLFHRILPATAWGLKHKTSVDWHLKVKDMLVYTNIIASQSACKKLAQFMISSDFRASWTK